jgi:hypothetical protein
MGIFQEAMISLESMGILDVILPFILVFVIVFAVLQKTKILGEDDAGKPRKNFNAVIALVMGLAVVIPHVIGSYPSPDADVVNIINQALPSVSIVLVAVVMMLLMIGVFGGGVNIAGSSLAAWAVIFSILATLFIFGVAANWFNLPSWLYWLQVSSEMQSLVVVILVFALIIWFITKEDKPKQEKKGPSFMEGLAKVMEKPGK